MNLFADVLDRVNHLKSKDQCVRDRIKHIESLCTQVMLEQEESINSLHEKLEFIPKYDCIGSYLKVGMSNGPGNSRTKWMIHIQTWSNRSHADEHGEGFEISRDTPHANKTIIPFSIFDTDQQIRIKFHQALRLLVRKALMYEY